GFAKPMFRRELVRTTGVRYPSTPCAEEYEFMLNLLRRTGLMLHFCPEPLYDYIQRPASLSRNFGRQQLRSIRVAEEQDATVVEGPLQAAILRRLQSIDLALVHLDVVDAL